VDIITLYDEEIAPAAPEPPKKSPKKKKKRNKSAQPESEGRVVIRLKTVDPAPLAEVAEVEDRSGSTAEFLETPTVHSAEDGAVLATEVASVQEVGEPVLSTDEVRPLTEGEGPIVETVGTPTLEATQVPEEIAQEQAVIERETVLVSQPSSPASTAGTTIAAGGGKAET
jgi:hypothetical protein